MKTLLTIACILILPAVASAQCPTAGCKLLPGRSAFFAPPSSMFNRPSFYAKSTATVEVRSGPAVRTGPVRGAVRGVVGFVFSPFRCR